MLPKFETVRSEVLAVPLTDNVAPGAVFKMPILELVVSKERNGNLLVEAANENAFTAVVIVEVDLWLYFTKPPPMVRRDVEAWFPMER